MNRVEQLKYTTHKIRGLLQILGDFVACMENSIEKNDDGNVNDINEYRSIVISTTREIEELLEKVKL